MRCPRCNHEYRWQSCTNCQHPWDAFADAYAAGFRAGQERMRERVIALTANRTETELHPLSIEDLPIEEPEDR